MTRAGARMGAAVFATMITVACGGGGASSVDAYATDYRVVVADYSKETSKVRSVAQAKLDQPGSDLIAVYRELRALSMRTRTHFGEIRPPKAIASKHESLLHLLDEQIDALGEAIQLAEADDPELRTSLVRLLKVQRKIADAHRAIAQTFPSDEVH